MLPLWALALVVVAAMWLQDNLATFLVIAEGRNLGRWAGVLDAANDYASRYGGAITAGAFVRWGLGNWRTQMLFVASAIASYVATNHATGWAHRFLPGHAQ